MKYKKLAALLICLLLSIGYVGAALGETYQTLCEQRDVRSENAIAWLEIPGASICEPVMRHPEDDAYYARRNANGRDSQYGSLYVQAQYNAADFSDPVTMVYGNSTTEDAPFGMLQQMYSGSFEECRQLFLHTPDGSREYIVFAAVPYTSIHVLHYFDFRVARRFNSFFDGVFSTRALAMHLDEDSRPVFGQDRVLILSTGLRGDSLQRYLVMAKEVVNQSVSDNK